MSRPRIFISSTFYDLRHIRSSLEIFVRGLGYEAIMSEKGRIAYDPDIPLDESCYREAALSDIFVLIIGGRYGSAASKEDLVEKPDFYSRYESVTRNEYQAAITKDIPIYILVDRSAFSEYETFKKNRNNSSIEYAHVDSINVFHLLDSILNHARNNPVHKFDSHDEIEEWLKEQWAGLFRELISRRSENRHLASMQEKIEELSVVSSSLQRYMESIISAVSSSPQDANKLIKQENARVKSEKTLIEFKNNHLVEVTNSYAGISIERIEVLVREAKSINGLLDSIEAECNSNIKFDREAWISGKQSDVVAEARTILGLDKLPADDPLKGYRPQRSK